jgi:hypothetical protein
LSYATFRQIQKRQWLSYATFRPPETCNVSFGSCVRTHSSLSVKFPILETSVWDECVVVCQSHECIFGSLTE